MKLHAQMQLERGDARFDIDLVASQGESLALVGPNAAGKTSCLHAIAGLLRIHSGSITLSTKQADSPTEILFDGGPHGPFVPPEDRQIGYVFQEHLLFPQLSALDNVAFGLRARGIGRRAARARAAQWLERVGLPDCGHRRPKSLSGGQSQRVALARALALEPRMLLLDEPLASVDASTRLALRRTLREQLESYQGIRIVVAHDALDAFALAERVAVLEAGRIVQTGTVQEVCSQPRSRYVADLIGLNFFRGQAQAGHVQILLENSAGSQAGGSLHSASPLDGQVLATIHPRAIALYRQRPAGSPRNVWQAPLLQVEAAADCMRIQLGGQVPIVAELTPSAVQELRLAEGGQVWVSVKASEVSLYPA